MPRETDSAQRERRFKGVPVGYDDGYCLEAYVDVTDRTQTAEHGFAALLEADVYEWGDELDHDLIAREPLRRQHYKLGGEGEIGCDADDPDRLGEWWIFDISKAYR